MNPEYIKEWCVYLAIYPLHNPNEVQDSKPSTVLVYRKDNDSFVTVIRITDLEGATPKTKGIKVLEDTPAHMRMGLDKNSFINLNDYQTISVRNFIRYFGKCPASIINEVKDLI